MLVNLLKRQKANFWSGLLVFGHGGDRVLVTGHLDAPLCHGPREESREGVPNAIARLGGKSAAGHAAGDERGNLCGGDGLEVRAVNDRRFPPAVLAWLGGL